MPFFVELKVHKRMTKWTQYTRHLQRKRKKFEIRPDLLQVAARMARRALFSFGYPDPILQTIHFQMRFE